MTVLVVSSLSSVSVLAGAAGVEGTRVPPLPVARRTAAGACIVAGGPDATPASRPGRPPATVPARPTGVVADWLPGLDDRRCRVARTEAGATSAASLAADVDAAPAVPAGAVYHCPMDDGTAVRLHFLGGRRRVTVTLRVGLSGCGLVTASGAAARRATPSLRAALRPLAPPAWRSYLAAASG
ncbi:MAG: hypothetical protein ACYCU7_03035 [Acidimicrobiales bacterium]